MKVIIREAAEDDLERIHAWIARDTRELVEYPYLIVYRVSDERREIVVLSIIHGAQDRSVSDPKPPPR